MQFHGVILEKFRDSTTNFSGDTNRGKDAYYRGSRTLSLGIIGQVGDCSFDDRPVGCGLNGKVGDDFMGKLGPMNTFGEGYLG